MKRSSLLKRSPLKRHTPLSRASYRRVSVEAGRVEWKTPVAGYCQCGTCQRFSMHLHRHHIITEQHVRIAGGDPWALSNSMLLHELCHARHHAGFRRIPLASVPQAALDFAVQLLGEDRTALYMTRFYAGSRA